MESNATKQDFEKELAVLEQKNQSLALCLNIFKNF